MARVTRRDHPSKTWGLRQNPTAGFLCPPPTQGSKGPIGLRAGAVGLTPTQLQPGPGEPTVMPGGEAGGEVRDTGLGTDLPILCGQGMSCRRWGVGGSPVSSK